MLILLITTPCTLATKKGYSDGYIVTLSGDTVYGMVKDRDPEPFVRIYAKIRFVEKNKRGVKKYKPTQIAGYKCGNREYRSVRLRETSEFFKFRYYTDRTGDFVFLRLMRDAGNLVHYEQEFIHDDNNFVDSFPLFHIPGSSEMVRVTQGILGLKKKRLSEYFSKCKALVEAVNSEELKTVDEVFDYYLEYCAE